LPADAFTTEDFRRATEEVLLRQAATGNGVILGRAAVIVLRGDPRVLRVRLDGPRERRIRQAMSLGQLDAETAQRALEHLDRIHEQYTRQLYGVDLSDPTLYHMVLDSTVISIDACVELIVTAARSLG
jgi:cytidylate kinase